jgi:hypothetical protein
MKSCPYKLLRRVGGCRWSRRVRLVRLAVTIMGRNATFVRLAVLEYSCIAHYVEDQDK